MANELLQTSGMRAGRTRRSNDLVALSGSVSGALSTEGNGDGKSTATKHRGSAGDENN